MTDTSIFIKKIEYFITIVNCLSNNTHNHENTRKSANQYHLHPLKIPSLFPLSI